MHAESSLVLESLDLICDSPFRYFEIAGSLFESHDYNVLKEGFFKSSKSVSCVHEIIPPSLSRNWADSSATISAELQDLLIDRLSDLSMENITFTEIDLSVDEITKDSAVQGVVQRAKNVLLVLQELERSSSEILLPLRFPKAIPKSFEWRYTTMLINEIAHSNVSSVVNLFPYEARPEDFFNFLKKTFYTTKAIRFCFDPLSDGYIGRESFKKWLQTFSDQGFDGKIILAPKLVDESCIKECLNQLSGLLKPYDFN